MRQKLLAAVMTMMLVAGWSSAWGMRELSDSELGDISAGSRFTAEVLDGVIHFQFEKENSQRSIEGEGTITVSEEPLQDATTALILDGNAQKNLTALVNVNAVNSTVSILINLNVLINSKVREIRQLNLGRRL